MIAIVILGIGMVMVATIFPIGIDMAAQTVQRNIAQAATDAATATLELKVPRLPPAGATGRKVIIAPDVYQTEFGPSPGFVPADIDADDQTALSLNNIWSPSWSMGYSGVQNAAEVVKRLRFFTEATGWAGEKGPSDLGQNAWDYAYVMPSQNLPPAYARATSGIANFTLLPSMIPPTLGQQSDVLGVGLGDRVYPPVTLPTDLLAPDYQARFDAALGVIAQERRYSWIAIHHVTDPSAAGARFFVTLLITHRGDLGARYARQMAPDKKSVPYQPVFGVADRAGLFYPEPDKDPNTDMLFPQPWLVRLSRMNTGTGEVYCTPAVAELLPPGSFFVSARSVSGVESMRAGVFHEVLSRSPLPPPRSQTLVTLQIRRQDLPSGQSGWVPPNLELYAWVIPPAIERSGNTYSFRAKSPVISVSMRMVQ